jgi:hypothetical protein
VISGASSVKIWHPPRTDKEKGSEEGRVRGNEWEGRKPEQLEISPPSWIGQQYSILAPCKNQSKDDMLSPLMYLDG